MRPRHELSRYLATALAVAAAAALSRLWFGQLGPPGPMALFYLAVTVAAWWGGLIPGIVATFLSLGGSWIVYGERLAPDGRLASDYAVNLALFALVGVVVSAFSEALHRGRREVQDAARARLAAERARMQEREELLATAREALTRAEEAGRMRDEFLATVSHELRNPLNAIVGWAHVLQAGGGGEEERNRALETIVRSAHTQARLVDDLLDVSRVIAGKMRLSEDVVDFRNVVEMAIAAARPQADAKGVQLEAFLDESATLRGDGTRLQQVISNLLDNAIKFTPSGGLVRISTRVSGATCELTVADTGRGIAPEFLPKVFEIFRQGESGSRRRHGGMGLGLAIVRQLVELHGGSVRAESAGEARGATFIVTLPVARVARPPEPSPSPSMSEPENCSVPGVDLSGITVLVIDDDEDTCRLLRTLLENCGARVVMAGSVAEAMAEIERALPDVVLSDIEMPEENGYDFIRWLRGRPAAKGGRLPAAALTAYARSEDRRRAIAMGFQLHAAKPIDPVELLTILANLVGRETGSTPVVR